MVITKNKVVSIIYELRIDSNDGKIIESLEKNSPLTFVFGAGALLPKFEDNLSGLKTGDKFDFNLACEDAYGDKEDSAIVDVPLKAFEVNGQVDYEMVKMGNNIPMHDGNGNRLNGRVTKVSPEQITMDFNHPLAGNHLFFQGEITEIREATEEELTHGHVHQSGNCGECSDCGEHGGCC